MMDKCPYKILDLSKDCNMMEVKKAYRKMALKYHPDRVEVSLKKSYQEKFCKIAFAYGILSDKRKRKIYDEYGILDDGQTDIIIDNSASILSGLKKYFQEEGSDENEEDEKPKETLFKTKWKDFWLGTRNTVIATCVFCSGKGQIEKEIGFFISEEKCENCKGSGEVEVVLPNNYNKTTQKTNYYGNHGKE